MYSLGRPGPSGTIFKINFPDVLECISGITFSESVPIKTVQNKDELDGTFSHLT